MSRNFFTKVGNFMLGNGFYIVLTLCVALIGFSGYYLIGWVTPTPTTTVTATPEITIPTPEVIPTTPSTPSIPTAPVIPEEETEAENESLEGKLEISPPSTETVATPSETREVVFYPPVEGEVLTPHSTEVLLYHPTMGDWRTHTGVDFSAEIGADVVASAEGTVLEVFTDAMSGVTIVIEHGNDVVTTYANLAPNPSVIEGEYVSSGQLIAVVGESALAEVNSPPHIHFEMKRDGVSVDPVAYLQVR